MSELIASIVNFFSHFLKFFSLFINDRSTKLIKDQKRIEFYQKAFNFLRVSFASWSKDFKAPIQKEQTVREFIDEFNKEIKENEPFFDRREKKRFEHYIKLARKHASLWSKPNALISKINILRIRCCQKKISRKLKWLSKRIGKEDEYREPMEKIKD